MAPLEEDDSNNFLPRLNLDVVSLRNFPIRKSLFNDVVSAKNNEVLYKSAPRFEPTSSSTIQFEKTWRIRPLDHRGRLNCIFLCLILCVRKSEVVLCVGQKETRSDWPQMLNKRKLNNYNIVQDHTRLVKVSFMNCTRQMFLASARNNIFINKTFFARRDGCGILIA